MFANHSPNRDPPFAVPLVELLHPLGNGRNHSPGAQGRTDGSDGPPVVEQGRTTGRPEHPPPGPDPLRTSPRSRVAPTGRLRRCGGGSRVMRNRAGRLHGIGSPPQVGPASTPGRVGKRGCQPESG